MLLKVVEFMLLKSDVVVGTDEDISGLADTVAVVVMGVLVNSIEAIEKQRRNIRAQIILKPLGIT